MAESKTATADTTSSDDRPIPLSDAEKRTAEASTSSEKAVTFTMPNTGTKVTATAAVRDAVKAK